MSAARVAPDGTMIVPARYMFFHCRSMSGVGDSRRRGMRKNERECAFPASKAETVMPSVWAMRIGIGVSVDML